MSKIAEGYGTKGIPRTAFEKEALLTTMELMNMINYLQFKKAVTIEVNEGSEIVQVLKRELLKTDYLYK